MTLFCRQLTLFLLAVLVLTPMGAVAQVTIIDDALDTDTSADYHVVNGGVSGGGDGTLAFAFDYSTLGIPPAPGTTNGSTTGVHMSVNNTLNNGGVDETEAYTIFHNTELVGVTDYTMTIDVWLGVWSPGDTGSTQHGQIGVAGDGTTRNHLFELTSAGCCDFSGSGHFIALSSDGADSSDYRHWEDNANGGTSPGPVNQFDPDYLSPDMGTNVTSANFVGFFENISNSLAPIPGVIGNNWATVKVEVIQSAGCPSLPGSTGCIKYYVRGGSAETTGPPGQNLPPEFVQVVESELQDAEGFVNFGLADLYSSVATVPEDQFAVFDNLRVVGSNLPGGNVDGDFNNDGQWDCADINALTAAIAASSTDLSFDMNGDSVITLADVTDATVGWLAVGGANNPGATGGNPFLGGDADLSGAVDGSDFGTWNANKFTSVAAWCSGDFNADGAVDGSDFGTWNANKFQTSADASLVPEPVGVVTWLVLAGTAMLTGRRR